MTVRGENLRAKSKAIACELFAALMKADRTRAELMEMVDVTEHTLDEWLGALHDAGITYRRQDTRHLGGKGPTPTLHCLQSRPFEQVDEV